MRKDGSIELLHPRCAKDRDADLEEVDEMIEHDEPELAEEELVWLLGDCPEFVEGHLKLGEIALGRSDVALARGHFGAAFQLAVAAIRRAGAEGAPAPYATKSNQAAHQAGKGLAWSLFQLGKSDMAAEIVATLLRWDPADPLNVKGLGPPNS